MKYQILIISILCLVLSACSVSPLCNSALPVELRSDQEYSFIGDRLDRVAPTPDAPPEVLFPYYQCLASSDQIEAMYRVGLAYEMGRGVEPDIEKAVKYYRKAAKGNDGTRLQYIPADEGRPVGETRFVKERNAQPRHAGAMYRLGLYYKNRNKKASDADWSEYWFKRAAKAGYEGEDLTEKEKSELLEVIKYQWDDKL